MIFSPRRLELPRLIVALVLRALVTARPANDTRGDA